MAQKYRRSKFQNLIDAPLPRGPEALAPPMQITDPALNDIARRVMTQLNAAAVAIAIGSGGEIVCRARAGTAAPELGTVVQADRGITGECISKAEIVRCDNVAKDERVNAAFCEQLGIRSILAAPLIWGDKAVGVIEAFFGSTNAFRSQSIEYLQQTAAQIVETTYGAPPKLSESSVREIPPETTLMHPTEPTSAPQPASPFETEEFRKLFASTEIGTEDVTAEPTEPAADREVPTSAAEMGEVEFPQALSQDGPEPIRRRTLVYVAVFICLGLALVALKYRHRETAEETAKPTVTAMDPAAQLQLKAVAGDPSAQYRLALDYQRGSGVPADPTQARTWLVRAANNGNGDAQLELAKSLERSGNLQEAYMWYVIAGLAGKAETEQAVRRLTSKLSARDIAQVRYDVGEKLEAGGALPRDPVAAYVWFELAEWGGDKNAQKSMQQLQSQLSAEQLRDAKARASAWIRRHTAPSTRSPNPNVAAAGTTGP